MAEEEKGLDYYLANPEELPEHFSMDQLEAMANGKEVAVEEEAQSEEASATDGTEAESEPEAKGEEESDSEKTDDEEAPVLSKDGKHTIPYAVLSKEREQRRAAEAAIQELQTRLASLEKGDEKAAATSEAAAVTDEDLEALREDFPALAATFEKLYSKVSTLESQLVEERSRTTQERAQTAQMTAQEAIDATPVLAYWQAENEKLFNTAIQFDDLLKSDPENIGLTLQERFVKVVAAVEAVHGKTELPPSYRKETTPEKGATPPKENIAEKAKKVASNVAEFKPKTLSDLPGGTPPASSELENIANMSPAQTTEMMSKMSPDQLMAFLAKYG